MAWLKTREIRDANITTIKIADANVTAKKLSVVPVIPVLTAGAEASNAIPVTIQLKDADAVNVSRVVTLKCTCYDANGLLCVVGDIRLAETGAGAEVTATAKPTLFITTSSTGAATVTVTDVSAASTAVFYLVIEPMGTPGSPAVVAVDFN